MNSITLYLLWILYVRCFFSLSLFYDFFRHRRRSSGIINGWLGYQFKLVYLIAIFFRSICIYLFLSMRFESKQKIRTDFVTGLSTTGILELSWLLYYSLSNLQWAHDLWHVTLVCALIDCLVFVGRGVYCNESTNLINPNQWGIEHKPIRHVSFSTICQ